MNNILDFLRKERLYVLILIFVLFFNAIVFTHGEPKANKKKEKAAAAAGIEDNNAKSQEDMLGSRKAKMDELLRKNERLLVLFSLVSILMLALVLLGAVIDIIILPAVISGTLNIRTNSPPAALWNLWDICKVVILFLFFGYMIILSEASLSRLFHLLKIDNFRMMFNSSILDILAVVFIIYFSTGQYGQPLRSLGIYFKNFAKNVFYGVVGYIALIPVLILILIATAFIINITKYVPHRQPVVELFMKERNAAFLAYSSLFAAIVGPIIEELFFRGFMYGALKKYIGVFWSMIFTASIFALLHAHIVGFVPIMALGILLAYLYEKTGTLVSSMTVHMIHNLSMVFLVFLVKQVGLV